jgi:hypothetical protein
MIMGPRARVAHLQEYLQLWTHRTTQRRNPEDHKAAPHRREYFNFSVHLKKIFADSRQVAALQLVSPGCRGEARRLKKLVCYKMPKRFLGSE